MNPRRPSPRRSSPLLVVVIAALLLSTTQPACMGSFAITKSLYAWNTSVTDSPAGQSLIFFFLLVIPVYGLTFAGDYIVFNVIEFWSGDNPLATLPQEGVTRVDANTVQLTSADGTRWSLHTLEQGTIVVLRDGEQVGQIRQDAAGNVLLDRTDAAVTLTSAEIAALSQHLHVPVPQPTPVEKH